jgi:hypothetical protein
MNKPERFSKRTLAKYIATRLDHLPAFNIGNGWNQVKGKGEEASRHYGEFDNLRHIGDEFELWPLINEARK